MDNSVFRGIVAGKSNVRQPQWRLPPAIKATISMRDAKDELDPPFEIIEPAEWRGPVVFNSPHSGSVYPRAFLLDLAARSRDAAPIRGFLRRRADPRRRRARPPADAGAFPALLCRRQPRALRARSAHVRRPPALVRQYPLHAGRRRARHGRPRGRRRPGNLRPAHPGRRRDPADRGPLQALSPRAAPAVHPRASRISAPPCWSIAIPCLRPRAPRTSGRAPTSCSATATAPAAFR